MLDTTEPTPTNHSRPAGRATNWMWILRSCHRLRAPSALCSLPAPLGCENVTVQVFLDVPG
jgi:hypothetical protein